MRALSGYHLGRIDVTDDSEVEEEDRVVVRLRRDARVEKLALADAEARQRDDCLRGADDARELVQGVDGHVVHRAAARPAEVPGRVDRASARCRPSLGLVLVVFAEGEPAQCP